MNKLILILVTAILSFSSLSMAADTEVKDTPEALVDRLQVVYDKLYSIDYRKLEIDDFKKYSEVLREIDSLKLDVKVALNQTSTKPQIKSVVYEETQKFNRGPYNNCGEYKDLLAKFVTTTEENGIRQCYHDGGVDCDVKVAGRIKSLTDLGFMSNGNYVCEVKLDVVITETF